MKIIAGYKYIGFVFLFYFIIGKAAGAELLLSEVKNNNGNYNLKKDSIIAEIKKKGNNLTKGFFIENKGQLADSNGKAVSDVLFYGSTRGVQYYIRKNGISYIFLKPEDSTITNRGNKFSKNKIESRRKTTYHRIDMEIVGANLSAELVKYDTTDEYFNFYLDHCPNGLSNIKNYKNIEFKNILPYIDLILYSEGENMKYDFIVNPGGNAENIKMKFTGQQDIKINSQGNLIVKSLHGVLTEKAPFTYQVLQNETVKVQSKFQLNNNILSFHVGNYSKNEPLIIDPTRLWGTYYGGNGTDEPNDIVYDNINNNFYIVGSTYSDNIGYGGIDVQQSSFNSNSTYTATDIFISKFTSTGNRVWTTYYGGENADEGTAIKIDKNGNIYIVGRTTSLGTTSNFGSGIAGKDNSPNVCVHDNNLGSNPGVDAVIAKFSGSGKRVWGTYFGGEWNDYGYDIAVDDNDEKIYVVGGTLSQSSIATTNSFQSSIKSQGAQDAFLVKFDFNGCNEWGTYYGGNNHDVAFSVVCDQRGNIFITGYTEGGLVSGALKNAYQSSYGGNTDAFISKFDKYGNLVWGSYFGSNGSDNGNSLSIDDDANIYLAGITKSTTCTTCTQPSNLISANAYKTVHSNNGADYDGFLAKISENGEFIWGTYLGGIGEDNLTDVNVSESQPVKIIVTGSTNCNDFPITFDGYQTHRSGGYDAIFSEFNPNGKLVTSTYYGGTANDFGMGVAIDYNNYIYIVGNTISGCVTGCDGLICNMSSIGAFQTTKNDVEDGFIAKFRLDTYEKHKTTERANIASAIISADNNCLYNKLTVNFDKYIKINSLDINDFSVLGSPNRIIQAMSFPSGVDYSKTFTMSITPAVEKDELLDLTYTGKGLDNLGIRTSYGTIPISIEYTGFNITSNAEALNCELSEITLCAPENFASPYVWTKDGVILYDSANPTKYSGNCITVKGAGKYSVSIINGSNCRLIAEPVLIH